MCAVIFSSALFAEAVEASQLVTQQSMKPRNNKMNNGSRDPNSWSPYFMKLKMAEPKMCTFTELNVGVGFLYFAGIRGNLEPAIAIQTNGQFSIIKSDKPLSGRFSYNRTPLVEAIIGMDVFNWWKVALSYQHQGGIVVQSPTKSLFSNLNIPQGALADFRSDVSLDAIMFKTYFMFPHVLVWKNMYTEPYLGLAVGPGWQTWTRIDQILDLGLLAVPIRQKISANCVFSVDLGFKLRKAMPNNMLSLTLGCKYNLWGQARSMGDQSDQYSESFFSPLGGGTGERVSLTNPLRIKTVYQFAPYIGAQISF